MSVESASRYPLPRQGRHSICLFSQVARKTLWSCVLDASGQADDPFPRLERVRASYCFDRDGFRRVHRFDLEWYADSTGPTASNEWAKQTRLHATVSIKACRTQRRCHKGLAREISSIRAVETRLGNCWRSQVVPAGAQRKLLEIGFKLHSPYLNPIENRSSRRSKSRYEKPGPNLRNHLRRLRAIPSPIESRRMRRIHQERRIT
jgi:hypothetical protein